VAPAPQPAYNAAASAYGGASAAYARPTGGAYGMPPAPAPAPQPTTGAQSAGEAFLTDPGLGAGTSGLVGKTVAEVERDLILDTLSHCFGNRTHAANILGISIRTLRNKLKQYNEEGFPVPQPGDGAR
jgi:DNA-binding NtrC family response regulator